MAMTLVSNNPANNLLPYYPNLTTQLNELFTQCDPLNGNYFVASGRDLVTFECLPSTSAPVWVSTTTYTTGQVVLYSSIPYIAIANASPNLAQIPSSSPTFWAAYSSSNITVYSAPDACTGRTANVDEYPVPVFDSTTTVVEFLILPSSVFTQASGQVQFLASSSLVYVYVRSL
jgi:hypothetical protein